MVQSKPQPNCDDCTMNASVRQSASTHQIMPHHTQPALEHLHVQLPFKISLHWLGIWRGPVQWQLGGAPGPA
eukprot:5571778-Amphidinium_carterae.1